MSHGLRPRTPLGDEESAAVVAATAAILSRGPLVEAADPVPAWRFSGRWFNAGRFTLRRPHRLN